MSSVDVKIKRLESFNNPLPAYETSGSSGFDVRANLKKDIILKPGQRALVPTGLIITVPEGYEMQMRSRSGLSFGFGVAIIGGVGTIDSDYRGEIAIPLINLGQEDYILRHGHRCAQIVVNEVRHGMFETVSSVSHTNRGSGGFGSTGIK